jgi:FixJ family two-component response regulator
LLFNRPDILLLDLFMPDMSGTQVQHALNAAGASFPVIIVTAYSEPCFREESMGLGAAAYLRKPLDVAVLLQTVTRTWSPSARKKSTRSGSTVVLSA